MLNAVVQVPAHHTTLSPLHFLRSSSTFYLLARFLSKSLITSDTLYIDAKSCRWRWGGCMARPTVLSATPRYVNVIKIRVCNSNFFSWITPSSLNLFTVQNLIIAVVIFFSSIINFYNFVFYYSQQMWIFIYVIHLHICYIFIKQRIDR